MKIILLFTSTTADITNVNSSNDESGSSFRPSTPKKNFGKGNLKSQSNARRSVNVVMEDVSNCLNDSRVSVSSDTSENSFRPSTQMKSLESSILKSQSSSKRSEFATPDDALSSNGDQSQCGEGNESLLVQVTGLKKQRDRGVRTNF